MLTVAEIDLLNEFIGPEGCFFQTIIEHSGFSLGCKIIYLKRAVTLNCEAFLNCLDTLYHQNNSSSLEFIRPLKHLNDLCFNNTIKIGKFGTKLALDFFFSAINPNINPTLFQEFIVESINKSIATLQNQQDPDLLKAELCQQIFKEDQVLFNPRWRHQEGLPLEQLRRKEEYLSCPNLVIDNLSPMKLAELKHPIIQNLIYFGILSHEQFQQLNPAQYLVLTDIIINQILLKSNIKIEERLMVRDETQLQNIIDAYHHEIPAGALSFADVLNLSNIQCRLIDKFITLHEIGVTNLPLRDLLRLNNNQIENLHQASIQFLLFGEVLNFQEAINISPSQRNRILRGETSDVVREIKYPNEFSSCCTIS
jgi:hypothetical protein